MRNDEKLSGALITSHQTAKTYASSQVVVEHMATFPEKTRPVSISEAYYHLYKWKFCGAVIDHFRVTGNDLWEVAFRMLKHCCITDEELAGVLASEIPSAFYQIDTGGKILTRVYRGVGLRRTVSRKALWQIIRRLAELSRYPKLARFIIKVG